MNSKYKNWCLALAIGASLSPRLALSGDYKLPFVPATVSRAVALESTQSDEDNVGGLAPELTALRYAPSDSRLMRVTFAGEAVINTKDDDAISAYNAPGSRHKPTEAQEFDHRTETNINNLVISFKGTLSPAILRNAGLKVVSGEVAKQGEGRRRVIVSPTKSITPNTVKVLADAIDNGTIIAAECEYNVYNIPPQETLNPREAQIRANGIRAANTADLPNDPGFGRLYGIKQIQSEAAWKRTHGGPIRVAVIDTGVSHQHDDLRQNMWINKAEQDGLPDIDDDKNGYVDDIHGFDFVQNDGDPNDAGIGHGTHCAGTIAARGNNGVGLVGVCWEAEIMALRIFDSNGGAASNVQIARAIDYAVDKDAKVISASWGGPIRSIEIEAAIRRANQKGILFVAAAGNSHQDVDSALTPNYPSGYDIPNIISVGAVDQNNAIASFSNYGRSKVDIGAPGVDILSLAPENRYQIMSGTSMATPHVAGAAALYLSASPRGNGLDAKKFLFGNSKVVDSLRQRWGNGAEMNRPGATLDIAAIEKITGKPLKPENPTITPSKGVYSASFPADHDSETTQHRDLAVATVSLAKKSKILVTANTGVRSLATRSDITLTVGSCPIKTALKSDPDSMSGWNASFRSITADKGRWANAGTHFEQTLPAGKHNVYWSVYLHDKNSRLQFDGGTMSVTVIPIE